jgi:hypothetical protein
MVLVQYEAEERWRTIRAAEAKDGGFLGTLVACEKESAIARALSSALSVAGIQEFFYGKETK